MALTFSDKAVLDGFIKKLLNLAGYREDAIVADIAEVISDAVSFATVNAALGMADSSISVNNQKIINLGTPTAPSDAVTKAYADSLTGSVTFANVSAALAAATGTISFNAQLLSSVADPVGAQDAATKNYVDNNSGSVTFANVNTALGTANASIGVNNQKIINLLDPTAAQDAATKNYVDTNTAPVDFNSVKAALAAANTAVDFNSQKLTGVADPTSPQDAATKAYVDSGVEVTFATVNAALATANAAISINGQNLTNAGNITPFTDNAFALGSSALRWASLHIGSPGGLVVHNDNTNTDKVRLYFYAPGAVVLEPDVASTTIRINSNQTDLRGGNITGIAINSLGNVSVGASATQTIAYTARVTGSIPFLKEQAGHSIFVDQSTTPGVIGAGLGIFSATGADSDTVLPGATGGQFNIDGGRGGAGTAILAAGDGANLVLSGGGGGTANGGSGGFGANVVLNGGLSTGSHPNGDVILGLGNTKAIQFVADISTTNIFFTKETTHHFTVKASTTTGVGGALLDFAAGDGAAASGATPGATGGNLSFFAGAGGGGTATLAAGDGAVVTIAGGPAGAANGGPGGAGGGFNFIGGAGSGGQSDGGINFGPSSTSSVTFFQPAAVSTNIWFSKSAAHSLIVNQAVGGLPGFSLTVQGGQGSNTDGISLGKKGGAAVLQGGQGGSGGGVVQSGEGGDVKLFAGDLGPGSTSAQYGGNIFIRGGSGFSAPTFDGVVIIGDATTGEVRIGDTANVATTIKAKDLIVNAANSALIKGNGTTAISIDSSGNVTFPSFINSNVSFLKEADHTIKVDASTTAATVGGALILRSGDGNGANAGTLDLDTGLPGGFAGMVLLGTSNATAVEIGRQGSLTGTVTLGGHVGLTGTARLNSSLLFDNGGPYTIRPDAVSSGNGKDFFIFAGATTDVGTTGGRVHIGGGVGDTMGEIGLGDGNETSFIDVGSDGAVVTQVTINGTLTINSKITGSLSFLKEADHTISIAASTTAATAGGALIIKSGNGNAAPAGTLDLDTGTGTAGTILLGNTNASSIVIGSAGSSTTFNGSLTFSTVADGFTFVKNVNHSITIATSDSGTAGGNLSVAAGAGGGAGDNGGNLALDAGNSGGGGGIEGLVQIGTTHARQVTIGRTGITTQIDGTIAFGDIGNDLVFDGLANRTIKFEQSAAGNPGRTLTIQGGQGAATFNGGSVNIDAGSAGGGGGSVAGLVQIGTAANTTAVNIGGTANTNFAGDVDFSTGANIINDFNFKGTANHTIRVANSAGAGFTLNILGGNASSGNNGGFVNIDAGSSDETGGAVKGSVQIGTGAATHAVRLCGTAKLSFFGATDQAQQTSGANLTNNVTAGGTDNTVDDVVAAAVIITNAADFTTTRNAIYQLARKLKQVNDALRAYGLLT